MEGNFSRASFLNQTNIYEVNVRQYTPEGTFAAFATHLPRLQHMGVQVLWLMPIHPIGFINRKGTLGSYYSVKDYKAINPEYGTITDFENLVNEVHQLGMKIIIDWVANHAAWDNVWTITNPDFFIKDDQGNFRNAFDWDDVIQIDHGNEAQQNAMIDAMQYWVSQHNIDGFRADLAHLTPLAFWVKARTIIDATKKHLIWLAETEEVSYHQAFDISYTWKWMHEAELFCSKQKTLANCVDVLDWYKNDFPKNALRLFFTSNHDENSWNGTEYEKYGTLAKTFAVLACTYIGTALIYSGQELPNKKRLPFFDKDKIEWQPMNELHTFYKTLLDARKNNELYKTATMDNVHILKFALEKNILTYQIKKESNEVLVILNLNEYAVNEDNFFAEIDDVYKNIFTEQITKINNDFTLNIEAAGYLVFHKIN